MNGTSIVGIVSLFFALTACGGGSSSSAPAIPPNAAPISDAGTAQSVLLGATVTLDGNASKDANGDTLTYSWTLSSKPAGSNAVLNSSTSTRPSLTPDVGGIYIASLVVSDGKASSNTSTIQITVTPPTDPSFTLSDGITSTVGVGSATSLGLQPWRITNGDKLSYSWTITTKPAGSNVLLTSANSAQAILTPDLPGNYVASLVASDGKRLSKPATTTITALDTTAFNGFVDLVNKRACNEVDSDLFLIDGKYVFASTSGNCSDAQYSAGLYGLTPSQFLCGVSDSIAGPAYNCPDTNFKSLLDASYAYRYAPNLGSSVVNRVSKFIKPAPVPTGATGVDFDVLDQGYSWKRTDTDTPTTAIVRNDADWAALWTSHRNTSSAPPSIDFTKKMVLAIFYEQLTSCGATSISRIYVQQNKLTVEYAQKPTTGPQTLCSMIAYKAAELVSIDIPAVQNLQVEFTYKKLY